MMKLKYLLYCNVLKKWMLHISFHDISRMIKLLFFSPTKMSFTDSEEANSVMLCYDTVRHGTVWYEINVQLHHSAVIII